MCLLEKWGLSLMSQKNDTWRDLFSLPCYEGKWLRLMYLKFCWSQSASLPKVNNSIKESTNHTYNQQKARTSYSLDVCVCVCHILATTSFCLLSCVFTSCRNLIDWFRGKWTVKGLCVCHILIGVFKIMWKLVHATLLVVHIMLASTV